MSNQTVDRLFGFFLEAAAKTYAGDTPKSTIVELPKSKVYRYEKDDLLYIDTYQTNGEFSGGQTFIYLNGVPVWMMQYNGWCKDDDKRVTTFLKQALRDCYDHREWYAGRGPRFFYENGWSEPGLVYENNPNTFQFNFSFFEGREYIYPWPGEREEYIFFHRYNGLLLIGDWQENVRQGELSKANHWMQRAGQTAVMLPEDAPPQDRVQALVDAGLISEAQTIDLYPSESETDA